MKGLLSQTSQYYGESTGPADFPGRPSPTPSRVQYEQRLDYHRGEIEKIQRVLLLLDEIPKVNELLDAMGRIG